MYDVISIGSATRDIFARAKGADIHHSGHSISGKEACLPLGAKIDIDEFMTDTGGGAANTSVSFSHFGMKAAPVCRVGKDSAGEEIKKSLKNANVDILLVGTDQKTPTAHSIILLVPGGERTILVYRGASAIDAAAIPWNQLRSRWLYISSLGGNLALLSRILKTAEERKMQVAWNPGGKEISFGIQKLSPFIRQTDVLIMNEEEARTLLSSRVPTETSGRGDLASMTRLLPPPGRGRNDNFDTSLSHLRPLPRRALAITQGARGATAADAQKILHAPAFGKNVVNTTGAGDAFSAGFIAGLWKWDDLSLALRLGILNSGMCVTKMGAKNGLLPRLPSKERLLQIPVMGK